MLLNISAQPRVLKVRGFDLLKVKCFQAAGFKQFNLRSIQPGLGADEIDTTSTFRPSLQPGEPRTGGDARWGGARTSSTPT